jgi:hypothetical protein
MDEPIHLNLIVHQVKTYVKACGLHHSAVDQVEVGPGATEFGQIFDGTFGLLKSWCRSGSTQVWFLFCSGGS